MGTQYKVNPGDQHGGWTVIQELEPLVKQYPSKATRIRRALVRCRCGVEETRRMAILRGKNPQGCRSCSLPLEGVQVGAGDGTGQRFAHPGCYANHRIAIALKAVSDAVEGTRDKNVALAVVQKELGGLSHILAVAL